MTRPYSLFKSRMPTLALLALCASPVALAPAAAQDIRRQPGEIVQPVPSSALADSLARIASNPNDPEALLAAGHASLAGGDPRAAIGFFGKAQELRPRDGRIKAGLGSALLTLEDPGEALKLFNQAETLGVAQADIGSDRGLAYELTGDNARALQDFAAAAASHPEDSELTRRYAVSLGIAGKPDQADRVLDSLLRANDRSAWRDRAFIYAINGRRDEQRGITTALMPAELAEAIQPFMDRMPALNPAQQAAAIEFGHFPAGDIQVAQVSPPRQQQRADAGLIPSGEPLGRKSRSRKQKAAPGRQPLPARNTQLAANDTAAQAPAAAASARETAQPVPSAPRQTAAPATVQPTPATVQRTPATVQAAPQTVQRTVQQTPRTVQPTPAPTTQPAPAQQLASSNTDTVGPADPQAGQPATGAPTASTPAQPAAETPRTMTLAEIMQGFQVPESERRQQVAAVDLNEVARLQEEQRKKAAADAAAKAKAEKEAKAKAAAEAKAKAAAEAKAKAKAEADAKAKEEAARLKANPERYWQQVLTGSDRKALVRDMAKLRKAHPDLFDGLGDWTAKFNNTNRALIGPFKSEEAARTFGAKMRKAGVDGYEWTSPEGFLVEKLSAK